MKKLFKSLLLKKLLSKLGIFFNNIEIQGLKFNDVKFSSLKDFYFNQNFYPSPPPGLELKLI